MFQISLRQLLMLVAAVAVAVVSLKYASVAWLAIVACVSMLTLFAALIVAAVDRGPRQAFAIGMVIVMLGYGLIVSNGTQVGGGGSFGIVQTTNIELNGEFGRLPTTRLLGFVLRAVVENRYIDTRTGDELPNYNPATSSFPSVSLQPRPAAEVFMPIGHCWWALLLGYLGGRFAQYVYVRRMNDKPSSKPE